MSIRLTVGLLMLAALLAVASPLAAAPPLQTDEVYVVQAGDTLFAIALRFGATVADIAVANNLSNTNLIFVGQRLIIPDAGPSAEPAIVANPGTSAQSPPATSQVYVVQPGDTLFSIATRFSSTVTDVALANGIHDPNYIAVGQRLIIPVPGVSPAETKHPAPFAAVQLAPDPVLQGQTLVVRVTLSQPATLPEQDGYSIPEQDGYSLPEQDGYSIPKQDGYSISGDFDGRPLFFTGDDRGGWAVVGIHALQDVGAYSLALRAKSRDGTEAVTAVTVVVDAGPYGAEDIQLAPGREDLLAPDVVEAEQARMVEVWSSISPRPLWEGPFGLPLTSTRVTSPFGTRRSYNEGPVSGFHGGIDFGAANGTPIYAPAAGRVVLAEKLTVRGNAVLIDHGLGVFSGYWHQSKLAVQVGQIVQRGDLIGYVGDTGLVSGAHLHWEMRVGGIAVDPMQWTQMAIP